MTFFVSKHVVNLVYTNQFALLTCRKPVSGDKVVQVKSSVRISGLDLPPNSQKQR